MPPSRVPALFVISTVSKLSEARRLAGLLVKKKLAACVNISSPVESHYVWQEKLQKDREYLLYIKTTKPRFPALKKELLKQHPYDVPEIIALPVQDGNPAYLKWVGQETSH